MSVSLAVYRLLLNASRLLRLTCLTRSLHPPSSQACHLLEVRTITFWTLRFCIPLLAEHLLEHLHPLLLASSWVLGSQSLAVSLASRPHGTCFIHHIQRFQRQLLPQNHGCRSIHGIRSIMTSQASGTHKPRGRTEITIFRNTYRFLVTISHAQQECPPLCRCTDL